MHLSAMRVSVQVTLNSQLAEMNAKSNEAFETSASVVHVQARSSDPCSVLHVQVSNHPYRLTIGWRSPPLVFGGVN
jgi:hypothetical protein